LTGDPLAYIKLLEDPDKNLVFIMKDGKVQNTPRCLTTSALSGNSCSSPSGQLLTQSGHGAHFTASTVSPLL
jgi:hypothetical protein